MLWFSSMHTDFSRSLHITDFTSRLWYPTRNISSPWWNNGVYVFIPIISILLSHTVYLREWWGLWPTWERTEIKYGLWSGNLKKRNCLEDVDGRIISKWILQKQTERMWTRFIWLWTGTCSRLLWTFWFHKMWGISF